MCPNQPQPLKADEIMQHDHEETVKLQDRERQQNRDAFASDADDAYSSGHNDSEYSNKDNQSRFSTESDYPDGNMNRYENRENESHFGRDNAANNTGRAYDRSADYEREREDDQPFIHDQADKFYGRRETVDGEGKPSEQFSSDHGQRFFGGDQGFQTKHQQDEEINKSVNDKDRHAPEQRPSEE